MHLTPTRRSLFRHAAAAWAATGLVRADGRPKVTHPRATSGDAAIEPDWKDQLTVTVGPKDADIAGTTERALQAAVDYVAGFGGGTVRVLPGAYTVRNSVFLRSNVRLLGSGLDSVLTKCPSLKARLSADSDWFDQEITLADAKGFQLGDGVCLRATNPHTKTQITLKRTLVARNGSRFKLDRPLRENYWLMGEATAELLFPVLTGEHIAGVSIGNIAIDGNKANNARLDGNHAGCLFFQDCNRLTFRGVTARNYNGDGISWQICHDVLVEDCHTHDNADLGLHPGSGSQRPLIRRNRTERNSQGLFFCWGVKYGLAEDNVMRDNRLYGCSIGHRDTDNIVRNNRIEGSGQIGILFRKERGPAFQGHRNRIEGNRIADSGGDTGVAIDILGETESIRIERNEIVESRGPAQRIGVRIGELAKSIHLADNRIEGVSVAVADLRKG